MIGLPADSLKQCHTIGNTRPLCREVPTGVTYWLLGWASQSGKLVDQSPPGWFSRQAYVQYIQVRMFLLLTIYCHTHLHSSRLHRARPVVRPPDMSVNVAACTNSWYAVSCIVWLLELLEDYKIFNFLQQNAPQRRHPSVYDLVQQSRVLF